MLALTTVATAQTKQTPPPAGPAPKIELGKYEHFTLKNGLKVYVVENHKLPVVNMSLVLDRDPILEGDKAGYVDMAGQMMRTGTKTRSKDQLDEEVDFIGASLSFNATGFNASSLKKNLPTLLNLTADALLNPNFTQEELDKVKKQMLATLASEKDNPDAIASKIRNTLLFGKNHPNGELMTEKSVENVSLADIQNYYNTYYRPNIGYLAVVGDVTPKEMKKLLEKSFGKWKKAQVPTHKYDLPKHDGKTQVVVVDRPSAVQSVLSFTNPAELKPGADDYVATQVMNTILGGGSTARLFMNLREKHGYTYGSYSSLTSDKILGRFNASASVRNAVTDSAATQFMYEFNKIRTEPVTAKELANAKAYLSGNFARGLENPNTVAMYAISSARYNLPADYYANYLKKVESITTADVQRAAQKYVRPDQLYILAVGNAKDIADKLVAFDKDDNTITYFDATGEKVDMAAAKAVPSDVTADQLISKYIQAIGGKANIEKVKDVTVTMNASIQGMALTMMQQQKGTDKILIQILMNNSPMQRVIINGDKGKMEAPMQGLNKEMTAEELAASKAESDMFMMTRLDKLGIKTAVTGQEKVDGAEAYVVESTAANGQKTLHYFDKATGLLLKDVKSMQTPQGALTQTKSYKNYKEVNGVKYPHVIETVVGPQVIKAEVQSVEVNKGISDDTFKI
ncbi:putative Zn-dependent peptidase [Pontibacter ramchanderi]|uniref:Putative Zn-dependent peptidase n=2 Tax=Pontibacter ramchanderi TaxID=1179743 RepID=A0A2N3UD98_9BACT|nr:putative Zn-dependent peptidase [Pontibacter ramchanderi]